MEFIYTSKTPNITATIQVIWGSGKPLDNPENIHVVIYRCNWMATDCGQCLDIPKKHECGWCQVTDQCEVRAHCLSHDSWQDTCDLLPYTTTEESIIVPNMALAEWVMPESAWLLSTITNVRPTQLQKGPVRTLYLTIENMPTSLQVVNIAGILYNITANFVCEFSAFGKTLQTNATRTENGVSCLTPRGDLL